MDASAKEGPPEGPRYSVLALCRNRAGYEAAPASRLDLDLAEVETRLAAAGVVVQGNAGVLLAVRVGDVEASVFESGKVLFKTRDPSAAERAMAIFRRAMGWSS